MSLLFLSVKLVQRNCSKSEPFKCYFYYSFSTLGDKLPSKSKYCPSCINIRSISTTCSLHVILPRITVEPSEAAQEAFKQEKYKPKQSPGHFHVRKVTLPPKFIETAKKIITDGNLGNIQAQAAKLRNFFRNRQPPVEDVEFKSKVFQVETRVRGANPLLEPFLSEKERNQLEKTQNRQIENRLKRLIYHWEPIEYTKSVAYEYLVGRTSGEYAALYRIFYEVANRDPTFQPETLFDFGCGVGSVIWSANEFWKSTLKEHMCIDMSTDMINLSDLLLRQGSSHRPMAFPGVYFRRNFPTSAHRKYDLTVCSHSLLEFSSVKDRINALDILWKKTAKYLVLVEQGTNAGFKVLTQARDYILQLYDEDAEGGTEVGHVFSPCPHDFSCPRIRTDNTPCNFAIRYQELMPFSKPREGVEIFSYVVFKKGPRDEQDNCWPRLVREPLCRPKHVICRLCTKNGDLSEAIFTKAKSPRELYRTARKSDWGDLLPVEVIIKNNLELEETSEGEGKRKLAQLKMKIEQPDT